MKKILLVGIFTVAVLACSMDAQAIQFGFRKQPPSYAQVIKNEEKRIKSVINDQLKFVNKHDLNKVSDLYTNDFVNNDGFTKDVYFKLVKETWETYPDISYKSEIKDISINDKYASVEVVESAVAVSAETHEAVNAVGELNTTSKCIYHLEKIGDRWYISSEDVFEETSSLKYGDARYLNIQLNVPKQVAAGKYYTTTLTVNAPSNMVAIGTINRESITYPQNKADEAFRVMPEDNILERMFIANTENVNEYNIASVAIARSIGDGQDTKVMMNGAAFVMSRINVVPNNNKVTLEEENAEIK